MPVMSAQRYHEYMLASESGCILRTMFQRAVLGLIGQRGSILDFGAGSGIDAKHYTENGWHVLAYDPSSDMAGHIEEYCGDAVRSGRVEVLTMDYPLFLKHSAVQDRKVDAITANFAVLNLVEDHSSLFEAFSNWVSPNGFILASVLSPYYLGDARYAWWWQNSLRFLRDDKFSVGVGDGRSFRHGLPSIERAARPHFELKGVLPNRGRLATSASTRTTPMSPWQRTLSLRTSLYMFLLFRRA